MPILLKSSRSSRSLCKNVKQPHGNTVSTLGVHVVAFDEQLLHGVHFPIHTYNNRKKERTNEHQSSRTKEKQKGRLKRILVMAQVSTCARFVMLAHRVGNVASTACCFMLQKHNPRDDIKISSEPARDSATEFAYKVGAGEDDGGPGSDDGGPGSDDEDVLTSLGASYRAWRVYHREKRAHDYTKNRLVESIRREAALTKQLSYVGSVEKIERTLMKLEELEATIIILKEKHDAVTTGEATSEGVEFKLGIQQLHTARLCEADAEISHWKAQCQQVQVELISSNSEKDRLVEELRTNHESAEPSPPPEGY